MDYSKLTLGELLSSENMAIRRNAIGILKQLQKEMKKDINNNPRLYECKNCGDEFYSNQGVFTDKYGFWCNECWSDCDCR